MISCATTRVRIHVGVLGVKGTTVRVTAGCPLQTFLRCAVELVSFVVLLLLCSRIEVLLLMCCCIALSDVVLGV